MKWLFIGLLVLTLSVGVALVALPDPGYVLIGYGKYSVETTLLVFIVVVFLVYLALRALALLWHVPGRMQRWRHRRQDRRLRALFNDAVVEMVEGRSERAERRLGRLTRFREAPLDIYLAAARAANRIDADNRRDHYLKLALNRHPKAEVAIALIQAELQLGKNQLEQAQTTLTRLQDLAPRSSEVLLLRMHMHLKRQEWRELRDLLPQLRHSQVLDENQWQQVALRAYREQMLELAAMGDAEALQDVWRKIPPPVQADEGLQTMYIEQLVRSGAAQKAENLLREQLRNDWNPRLAYLYGDVQGSDAAAQQSVAERWLEYRPEDPVLLLTLGKISLRNQLWGKARTYLEASIAHHATPEAYHLLGTLLERLEDRDKAADCYRKGIELLGEKSSEGPAGLACDRARAEGALPALGSA